MSSVPFTSDRPRDVYLQGDLTLEEALAHPLVEGMLAHTSDGALVIDARTRQIVAMNDRARELLGYEPDEPVGCQCKRLVNSPACVRACPLERILSGEDERAEIEMFYRGSSDGAPLHARTRMFLVRDGRGQPLAAVELFCDLQRVRQLERQLRERQGIEGIVGSSEPMQRLYELVAQIAPHDLPVLLEGESGTGKERFADAIHARSPRASGPFIKVNCAALAPSLVESELFGHVKGAFTGASQARRGKLEAADGGTLLLDEVGELEGPIQAKLLRALQDGEVQRVGEERPRHVDVRIIAATNRDLARAIGRGEFRQDLYYRLLGARLEIPPLRERRGDIPALARHFLEQWRSRQKQPGGPTGLSAEAMRELLEQRWPGNVRELKSAVELAAIRAGEAEHIEPEHVRAPAPLEAAPPELPLDLEELEAMAIERALARTGDNITEAAQLLGINRTTLWRKLRR